MSKQSKVQQCQRASVIAIALTLCAVVIGAGTAAAAGPPCAEGSTYNKDTRTCDTPPVPACVADLRYEEFLGACIGPFTCPEGFQVPGEYTPCTDGGDPAQSVVPLCPPGSDFDGYYYVCTAPPVATCPEGFTLDELGTVCSSGHLRGRSGRT